MKHGHKVELDDSISMFVGSDVHENYLQAAVVDETCSCLEEFRLRYTRVLYVGLISHMDIS